MPIWGRGEECARSLRGLIAEQVCLGNTTIHNTDRNHAVLLGVPKLLERLAGLLASRRSLEGRRSVAHAHAHGEASDAEGEDGDRIGRMVVNLAELMISRYENADDEETLGRFADKMHSLLIVAFASDTFVPPCHLFLLCMRRCIVIVWLTWSSVGFCRTFRRCT